MTRRPVFTAYLTRLALIVAAGLLIVGGINFAIDPYGVWNAPAISRFNAAKPAQEDHELLFKAVDVARRRPVNLLLGSSRVDLGLDPSRSPALDAIGGAYNLGLVGGYIDVILNYYKHAYYVQPSIRHVVLGLDFFAFNANNRDPAAYSLDRLQRRTISLADANGTLMSRDALSDSYDTVVANFRDPDFRAYSAAGMMSDTGMRRLALAKGMPERFDTSIRLYLNTGERYADFELSERAFADFREIVRFSREHGIDLRVFLPPEHVVLAEALRVRGLWCTYLAWKSRVTALTPVWDFSGYNPITTEPITRDMKWYWDASHFRREVGDLILDRMFDRQVAGNAGGLWTLRDRRDTARMEQANGD